MSKTADKAAAPPLDIPSHVKYIQGSDEKKDSAYHSTAHSRSNGVYWGSTASCIMGHKDALDRDAMIDYVMECWDEEAGAFGAHPGHDAHIHATSSALQVLIMQDASERCDVERVVKFLLSLVWKDGSVAGDEFGERDTRFAYILVSASSSLGRSDDLEASYDGKGRELVIDNFVRSMNYDGAFGAEPGAESHGAQVWVSVAALAISGELDRIDGHMLGWWLSERQLPNGGSNGRPEKLEDVCYSWWNLAGLAIIGKSHWINRDKLISFILSAQDEEDGGIADRPGDWVDVFHTVFGLAGSSLLGYPGSQDIDPSYCMPADVIAARGLKKPYKALPRLESWPPAASAESAQAQP